MSDYPISVSNITKRFGEFVAVDHLTFQVNPGEVLGWLGPNGAGKTTTIRMLLGLMRPTEGEIRVLGYNPVTESKKIHKSVGYMSQQFTLYNDLTALENIRFYGTVYGLSDAEMAKRETEILQMAGLEANRNRLTAYLSGAGASGWRWVAPSSITPSSFSWTSRQPGWTR